AEDGIRDSSVTGVQTCALPISRTLPSSPPRRAGASTPFGELLAVGGRVLAHDSAPELVVLGEQATERAALGLEARVVDRRLRRQIGRASCRETMSKLLSI